MAYKIVSEGDPEGVSPRRLTIVEISGKWYFQDDRLKEYRNVSDPYDKISIIDEEQ